MRNGVGTFRGEELPFFDVDGSPGFCGGQKKVGLTAEKCRDLEKIDKGGCPFDFFDGMDIGRYGNAKVVGNLTEPWNALIETGPTLTGDAGAIGFIVGSFEDVLPTEIPANIGTGLPNFEGGFIIFQNAGTADEEKFFSARGERFHGVEG